MSVATAEPMPNSSRFSPAPNALTAELWISFAALLRSHVAMRSVAEPNAGWRIAVTSATSLEAGVSDHRLRVSAPKDSEAGIVDWLTEKSERVEPFATFSFGKDGQIFFVAPAESAGREAMEMEAAVEWLLDEVCMRENR